MDRRLFRRLWSGAAWIILIASWVVADFRIFGIDPFFIVLPMWLLGGVVTNLIYGKPEQQEPAQDATYHQATAQPPSCPSCGHTAFEGDKFCEECGTRLENPADSSPMPHKQAF